MKFIFINGNQSNEFFRVHQLGCPDIQKDEQHLGNGEGYEVEAENVNKAVKKAMNELIKQDGSESGWRLELWIILPCCKKEITQ